MSRFIPPGEYVGQLASEFHVLHQWDGREWVKVPDYQGPPTSRGWIRFDVEDEDPPADQEDAVDKAFKP